jgi:hypothetical protein
MRKNTSNTDPEHAYASFVFLPFLMLLLEAWQAYPCVQTSDAAQSVVTSATCTTIMDRKLSMWLMCAYILM